LHVITVNVTENQDLLSIIDSALNCVTFLPENYIVKYIIEKHFVDIEGEKKIYLTIPIPKLTAFK
jgi:hypothetical protein